MRRENEIACTIRPRDSGGGGPLELAKRANRGGGGTGLDVSLSSKEFRRVRCPLHHPASQAQPTLRVGVLYVKHGGRRPRMPPPPLSRWRMKESARWGRARSLKNENNSMPCARIGT